MFDWFVGQFLGWVVAFWTVLGTPSTGQAFNVFFLLILSAVWYYLVPFKEKWLLVPAIVIGMMISPLLFLLLLVSAHVFFGHYRNWFAWFTVAVVLAGIVWVV